MKESRFSEEQIVTALKLAESSSIDEVCRKLGVTRTTFYRWKKKYGGMDVNDARRLKQLEDENRGLKKLVADQALDVKGRRVRRLLSIAVAMLQDSPLPEEGAVVGWIRKWRACGLWIPLLLAVRFLDILMVTLYTRMLLDKPLTRLPVERSLLPILPGTRP
jgi:putative transposase